ncbi:YfgM family protein [Celerinatantimonas yamalensis]|uniref:Ancillary SecYEG translocon subunit n=1 Tax=Celerinatantimonas yamalensis TaxID=559956 RepID=A0ABW9G9U8_9GAMM
MEIYATEEQQEQAVLGFLQRYWIAIVALIVIVLVGGAGWFWYQHQIDSQTQTASQSYQDTLLKAAQADKVNPDVFKAYAKKYQGAGSYPQMAQLMLANRLVQDKHYVQAATALSSVVTVADEPIKSLAALRLARVQSQLKNYDAAMKTLDGINLPSFKGIVESLKGDVWVAKGNVGQARNAYQQALADGEGSDPALQQKIDNLAGE